MHQFTNRTFISIIVILIVTNIITAGFCFRSRDKAKAPALILAGSEQQSKPEYSYKDNSSYTEKVSHYSVYCKKGNIVMLGNSITARVDWSELLNRDDIINRGIGSDITEGFLNRMEYIYSVDPKICYIMGGVNDIARKVPQERTAQNIKKIIEELKQHNIIPVLQSVLYVADTYPNNIEMNQKIMSLDLQLEKIAKECDVIYLDLNSVLSSGNQLITEYAIGDGIHLNGSGYEKWKTVLLENLKKHGL